MLSATTSRHRRGPSPSAAGSDPRSWSSRQSRAFRPGNGGEGTDTESLRPPGASAAAAPKRSSPPAPHRCWCSSTDVRSTLTWGRHAPAPRSYEAGFPGEAGGEALADSVCSKNVTRGGRLTVSFPAPPRWPRFYNHRTLGGATSRRHPSGVGVRVRHGLAYTTLRPHRSGVSHTVCHRRAALGLVAGVSNTGVDRARRS